MWNPVNQNGDPIMYIRLHFPTGGIWGINETISPVS